MDAIHVFSCDKESRPPAFDPKISEATSALDGVTAPLQGLVKVDVTGQEPQQMWLWAAEGFPNLRSSIFEGHLAS